MRGIQTVEIRAAKVCSSNVGHYVAVHLELECRIRIVRRRIMITISCDKVLHAFDMLVSDGQDLRKLPLTNAR